MSLSVFDHRPEGRFRRLLLLSHRFQIEGAERDALVVTNDWLTWRLCLAGNRPVAHVEGFMADWPPERGDPDGFYQRHGSWMMEDGRDPTLFDGISLGKQFNGHVVLMRHLTERLWHALDAVCRRYGPEEIVLVGLRVEYGFFDAECSRLLARALAERHGARLIDRLQPDPDGPGVFAEAVSRAVAPTETGWKPRLRRLYGLTVEGLSLAAAAIRGRKPRVFLLLNWIGVRNLIRFFDGGGATPLLLAEQWPKTPGFIGQCLRKGVLLARLPESALTRSDRDAVAAIEARLAARPPRSADPAAAVEALYVRNRIVATGAVAARAAEVRRFRRFLERYGTARVVVGESANMTCRMIADLAHVRGSRVDELLNGMFVTRQRVDTRCGDAFQPPVVDRLLAWGRQQEEWAEGAGVKARVVRTGYPSLDLLRRGKPPPPRGVGKRALVLPLTVDGHDLRGLYANPLSYLVELVRGLAERGWFPITVKLHPGFPDLAYYQELCRIEGLDCVLVKQGDLAALAAGADAVMGPVNSGSMLEVQALGRPYYPMRAVPSSLDPALFGGARVYDDVASLLSDLDAGIVPEGADVLDRFCAVNEIPNASARFWKVLLQTSDDVT